ncbi:MAG TPA: Gfo/Idh/MocA family oxidoreductase, partial [Clostridia bacterium]|nr:Gfo/Idh/MocA family oxidoreductase [Clostridia bacterium]
MNPYKVGLIGCGYWGFNLLRNLISNSRIEICKVCDTNPGKIDRIIELIDYEKCCFDAELLFLDESLDIIIISTPANTHFELVKRALEEGKNVFVEKPFVTSSQEALVLSQLARSNGLMVMVDHTYLFTKEYQGVKNIIHSNKLGRLFHYHSTRADFGIFPTDVNVFWHLFYHDAYILLDLFPGEKIHSIKAASSTHIVPGFEDVCIVFIDFESGLSADFVVNMLWPKKERKIIIAGSDSILLWDDCSEDKLRIYNKSAQYDILTDTVKYTDFGNTKIS